ncbi:hypothetical protein DLAC_03422 [Tieghemostelium lacteum]|uniref:KOW domain-containing protein n=1 Tax=Tieghemostelium lacteum TaxID=361077 RepID=A0A152A220_TIELA|nr:hypothetical protein DLAC_03422 [Tieghemostelium lacteum]|eukprot:KYR00260.1 hypothetical protein DLAC_03422 [Tieghemostelium lacteum]
MSNLFGGRFLKDGLFAIAKWKYIKGDKIQIISGRDKGKQGIVKSVNRKHNNVIVEGLKLIRKQTKSSKQQRATTYTKESPIHYSNLAHIDPKYNVPCKVRFQLIDGVRERVSKITNTIIPKPSLEKYKSWKKDNIDGVLDTQPQYVNQKTYDGLINHIDPRPTI